MPIFALLGIVLATCAYALVPDSNAPQYQGIPGRNVFGLRPPPAQPAPTNSPALLPKIILTGITTILGDKRALMKVQPAGLKPSEAAKEFSLILTEGQREGEVEVLQIDEKAGSVTVNNLGTVMTLTFEKNGAELPASRPVPPGFPGAPGALPASAGQDRFALPAGEGPRRVPLRNPGVPAAAASLPAPTSPTSGQNLTAEEQIIAIELQRQATLNNPSFPPLPPTPLTPSATE